MNRFKVFVVYAMVFTVAVFIGIEFDTYKYRRLGISQAGIDAEIAWRWKMLYVGYALSICAGLTAKKP